MVSLFCPDLDSNTTKYKYSQELCRLDVLSCIPHLMFILLASVVLLVYGCCPLLRRNKTPYTLHYHLHNLRWILLLSLLVVLLFFLLEGVLSSLKASSSQPHLYLPASCALVAAVLASVYYHHMEAWLRPNFMWLLWAYWIMALVGESLRLDKWYKEMGEGDDRIVRYDMISVTILWYCLLVIVELGAVLMSVFGKSNQMTRSLPKDLQNPDMRYYMGYVSFLSDAFFTWEGWLLKLGHKRPLEISDLGALPEISSARFNQDRFESCLRDEMQRAETKGGPQHFSLYRVLLKAYIWWHFWAFVVKISSDILHLFIPLTVGGVITYATVLYYEEDDNVHGEDELPGLLTYQEFFNNGFVLLGIMVVIVQVRSLLLHQYYHLTVVSGIYLRAGLQAAVYNKMLRLSSWTITGGSMTTGHITNFMSVDAMNLVMVYEFGSYLYSLPLMIIVLMSMLYFLLGVAALIAALCFVMAVPVQYKLAQLQARLQKHILRISDERLKQTHEMLQGMKLLKLYGWEKVFADVITTVRNRQIQKLVSNCILFAVSIFISYMVPALVTLLCFSIYVILTGNYLTPAIAFTTLTIVDQLRFPVQMWAQLITHLIKGHISVKRLSKFFLTTEVEIESVHDRGCRSGPRDGCRDSYVGGTDEARPDVEPSDETAKIYRPPSADHRGSPRPQRRSKKYLKLDTGTEHRPERQPDLGDGTDETGQSKKYLKLDTDTEHRPERKPDLPDDIAVRVEHGHFTWDPDSLASTLVDVNVEILAGSLTMIVGQVGTGKSSLLSALLGEMHTVSGSVTFNRNLSGLAYSAQKAWLLNTSLRENITFGQQQNQEKYEAVISACSLQPDIDILPAGDQTEIGEKGINLSGGQKQRVSVARAIYSGSNIVILDDPLSALDVHVGSHLFQDGILGLLLGNQRTVVLVTHQVHYMKYAHKVLVMREGRVALQGTPSEIWAAEPDLKVTTSQPSVHSVRDVKLVDEDVSGRFHKLSGKRDTESEGEEGRLIEAEERNTGVISRKVVSFYLKAMRYPLAGLVLLLTVMHFALSLGTNFWLSNWSEAGERLEAENATHEEMTVTQFFYIYTYTGMLMAAAILSFIATLVLLLSGIVAAKRLHKRMLTTISCAPMRFFDTTPVGRILNRFSSDTNVVDSVLSPSVIRVIDSGSRCVSAILVNSIISPVFLLVVLPVAVCYIVLQRYFIAASRELQRLDSITKSPIYANFSESLSGLSTIRAYRDEKRFKDYMLNSIDQNTLPFLNLNTCNRWLGVRLDTIGCITVGIASLTSLIVASTSGLEPSYLGLALAYNMAACTNLNWFVRQTSELEMQMNAVERIKYYTEIETENYQGTSSKSDWPDEGAVTVQDVSVRYADKLEAVLSGLSLEIVPGHKVGICGRTGSGKSSLMLAFFRIVDTFRGSITIDNVDIASLPLESLRQKLSIIPQDPILFTGSIRFNLDPLFQSSEEELWKALEIAQLKTTVSDLEKGLDYRVAEGGENFSMGQRQLFCLARAFLRKSRLLFMDEATASIDLETDDIVQRVLAKEFSDRTILVIAHRVTTILDADRIVVLSEGAIVEHDTPNNLLAKEDSQFASFVRIAQEH